MQGVPRDRVLRLYDEGVDAFAECTKGLGPRRLGPRRLRGVDGS